MTGLRYLLVLGIALCCTAKREDCPDECDCSVGVQATCTRLPAEAGVFPSWVEDVEVKDVPREDALKLGDHALADLGLKDIKTFTLTNTSLMSVAMTAFRDLTELISVDLSNNHLILIHPDTFSQNGKLQHLVLSGNPLQLTQFLNQTVKHPHFINSESLSDLLLSNCQLRQIAPFAFSNLVNLEYLDLSNNQLKSVRPDMFARMESLDVVNLSDNLISDIDQRSFDNVEDMSTLNLSGNPITDVSSICVRGLNILDVSRCKLEVLSQGSFLQVAEVSELNLSSNAISSIDPEAFSPLGGLMFIDLSRNAIKSLPPTLFSGNRKLEKISLAGNKQMKKAPVFEGMFSYLYYYDLSNCGIQNISHESFSGMSSLVTLNLSQNHLMDIEPKALSSLKSLKQLDLSNNKLRTLDIEDFAQNFELTKLDLSGNLFHRVPISVFLSTPKLYHLDLSNCRLTSLWNMAEYHTMTTKKVLRNLATLKVSNNLLRNLHLYQFLAFTKLEVLGVSGNPLQCSNEFAHIIEWFIKERIVPNSVASSHPVDLSNDRDMEEQRLSWAKLLNDVCPLPSLTPQTKTQGSSHDTESEDIIEETMEIKNNLKEDIEEEELYSLPFRMMVISLVSAFVVVLNLVIFIIFRSRHTYRGIKTTAFISPLDGHFQVRRGGRLQYQKLYEECSVPIPAPVHSHKISSLFGKNKPNSELVYL